MTPNPDMAQSQSNQPKTRDARDEQTNLSFRYGCIGIDAVAAAVRYAGTGKNPAHAPTAERIEERFFESVG